ncbi:MAG: hypothetical protein LBL90_05505 [Prevotellaceae bacterium]|jgi:chloramphenicol O-acetyltransferase type A|nr:hypothetical protein [Prevotellaceae bacterium]
MFYLISAAPNFYFTAITHTPEHRNGSNYPLLKAGKAIQHKWNTVIPIAILAHYGLVDGFHLFEFFSQAESYLLSINF